MLSWIVACSLLFVFATTHGFACDNSGFTVQTPTLNPNGTVSLPIVIHIDGNTTPGVPDTHGIIFSADAPIVSVSPNCITNPNTGVQICATINGTTVIWGDPENLSVDFLDADTEPAVSIPAIITLASWPSSWNGSGQEAYYSQINTVYCAADSICYCPTGPIAPFSYDFEGVISPPNCGAPPILVNTTPTQVITCEFEPFTFGVNATNADYIIWTADPNPEVQWAPGSLTIPVPSNATTPSVQQFSLNLLNNNIPLANTGISVYAINECGQSSVITFSVGVHNVYPATQDTLYLCSNETVTLADGNAYSLSNLGAVLHLSSEYGCDSTAFITFLSKPPIEGPDQMLSICTSATFTAPDGEILSPGDPPYPVTLQTADGCDSTVTYIISGIPPKNKYIPLFACPEEFAYIASLDKYLLAGTTWDTTLVAASGCDSIAHYTVNEYPTYEENITEWVCQGDVFVYNNISLGPGSNNTFNLQTDNGCDSTINLSVKAYPVDTSFLDIPLCEGTSTEIENVTIFAGDTTFITLTDTNQCDSILIVRSNAIAPLTTSLTEAVCAGGFYTIEGVNIPAGSSDTLYLTSSLSCDSIVYVTVNELPVITNTKDTSACAGSFVEIEGVSIIAGASDTLHLTAASGCDSLLIVNVSETEAITNSIDLDACENSSTFFDGVELFPNTSTPFNYTSAAGCDSVLTVTVNEVAAITNEIFIDACENSSTFFDGVELFPNTSTPFNYTSAAGCDSVLTVTVNEVAAITNEIFIDACENSSTFFDGVELFPNTSTPFNYTSAAGCDSLLLR
ncbi:MAG: hypothetical protein H6554_10835 [Chitinophagales bacterium]|nr:hypothetical protein [Chitinophagales bacterium]